MNSRLDELQELRSDAKSDRIKEKPKKKKALLEKEDSSKAEQSQDFQKMRTSCDIARQLIEQMAENNKKIDEECKRFKRITKDSDEGKLMKRIDKIIDQSTGCTKKIGSIVKQCQSFMKNKNEMDEDEKRMMQNTIGSVLENYKEEVQTFQNMQEGYRTKLKGKMKRKLQIIDGKMDDDQIEEALDNPEILQKKMQKSILGKAHHSIVNAVRDIQEQNDDVILLEKNITQLMEILKQINEMIFENGKGIDSMANNVEEAKGLVEKGEKNLDEAKDLSKDADKKRCWIFCCIIMAAVVILAPLALITSQNVGFI